MNKDQESSSSIEESEEEAHSEHGATTDAENEEIDYWERLKRGILPFPAPLRLQSLLFIIGHLDQYRNETLALLPPRTRLELLLNLPVIDVCRLEGSGVTEDIDMEEVWKTFYYNRLPTHQKTFEKFLKTVDDNEEMDSWKDCYFTSLYDLRLQQQNFYDDDCNCFYGRHLQQDLLYGMYSYNGTLEVQECFGSLTRSCFGVETCARHCSRLTPWRYYRQYLDPRSIAVRTYDRSPPTAIYATIPILVEKCKFEAKEFRATHRVLTRYFDDECFTDDYFHYWKLFLGSVRHLSVAHDKEQFHPGWKCILDAIFCSSNCKLSKLYIHVYRVPRFYGCSGYDEVNQWMALLVPYLSPTPGPDTLAVPYAYLREVHIVGAIQSAADAFNTSLILNHQNALEVVAIDNCNCFTSETPDAHLPLALITFLKKPSFKELNLCDTKVPTSLALKLLHEFFSSQSANHQKLCFNQVKIMPDKAAEIISIPRPVAVGSRSLEIVECELQPEIASVFPSSMSFRKLTIDTGYKQRNAIFDLFSHVKSLKVEKMSLSVCTSNENSKAVVNLLNLVETRNWSLHFHFDLSSQKTPENTATLVDAVTDVTPTLGRLVTKGIVTRIGFDFTSDEGLPEPVFETLLEEVFNGIQHSRSRIELDLSDCRLSYSYFECFYRTWNRCTDVKLKKLDLTQNHELPQDISNLEQMTDELVQDSD